MLNGLNQTLSITAQEAKYNLEQHLILSHQTQLSLQECIAKLKYHRKIYDEWNFKSVDPNGASLIINFYGDPGTGKTLAAEALAGTLQRPIIKVGIADIESKYMGESAKNIQAVFDLANQEQAVLFFDEADTMLGKRLSNVTQGTDNEVNSVRTTLLLELEKFDGIVIFATNFIKNYDSAFISRISYQIKFELPDFDARLKLWNKFLVPEIPLTGARDDILNQLSLQSETFSGRDIRKCLRLALPKVFQEQKAEHQLTLEILMSALEEIKLAKSVQRTERPSFKNKDTGVEQAVAMLGIKQNNNEVVA